MRLVAYIRINTICVGLSLCRTQCNFAEGLITTAQKVIFGSWWRSWCL